MQRRDRPTKPTKHRVKHRSYGATSHQGEGEDKVDFVARQIDRERTGSSKKPKKQNVRKKRTPWHPGQLLMPTWPRRALAAEWRTGTARRCRKKKPAATGVCMTASRSCRTTSRSTRCTSRAKALRCCSNERQAAASTARAARESGAQPAYEEAGHVERVGRR